MEGKFIQQSSGSDQHQFVCGLEMNSLKETEIERLSIVPDFDGLRGKYVLPAHVEIGFGVFDSRVNTFVTPVVTVRQSQAQFLFTCTCNAATPKLCEHEAQVLYALLRQIDLRIFFDEAARKAQLIKVASDFGLDGSNDLESLFTIAFADGKASINPLQTGLIAVTDDSLFELGSQLISARSAKNNLATTEVLTRNLIIREHKYYKNLVLELYDAPTTKEDKIKSPLTLVDALELIWKTQDVALIKFFTAVFRFQSSITVQRSALEIMSLKSVLQNPLLVPVYIHDQSISEKVTPQSLAPVKLRQKPAAVSLHVSRAQEIYTLCCKVHLGGQVFDLNEVDLVFTYFLQTGDALYLVEDLKSLEIIYFFRRKNNLIQVHESKFKTFKAGLLDQLEQSATIQYEYLKPATSKQLAYEGFDSPAQKIIYLSDAGNHILINPVMKYGPQEISIRTRRQIFGKDRKGTDFIVRRNVEEEVQFMAVLTRQHPDFAGQLENDLEEFYLHKERFLDEDWFLNAFDEWRDQGITILGFNELSGNKRSAHKARITVRVTSGLNWFNTAIEARFGNKKAGLKQLHKAIRNKSKFVTLDDGTQGLLPNEWIEKLAGYFQTGDVFDDDLLRTPKINYTAVAAMYDAEMLDETVKQELNVYQQKLSDFHSIQPVKTPDGLNATLRHYQQEGLNWLNFLDDFNFGGCLADDMGLGKTLQILAFVLLQRQKVMHNVNLLVVPTSLIFNWQEEVTKFAPSIQLLVVHGANRPRNTRQFDDFELIITTYGTLLSDIGLLKKYTFNYIFLDESQYIKNPDSERYKATRLLQSRNKIAITGTPIENNTFDLYGQLSFACPGLLGSKQFFRDVYAIPIDRYKVKKRAQELHQKIKPFMLRRTKEQVAPELPDKTEIVLHCEMEPAQRKVYDAYEKELRDFIDAATNEELTKSSVYVLKGLTRLRQICDSPLLMKDAKYPEASSSKINMLMEQIETKAPQHKILVFSQFVGMLELIRAALDERSLRYSWLTGNTKDRAGAVNEFQEDPEVRVFLISLKAGGTGLNLTAADYVYLVDPWWNPAVENQAIDRVYRIGQSKKVMAVRLICPDTVEEKMRTIQTSKTALANDLISTENNSSPVLDRQSLLALLAH